MTNSGHNTLRAISPAGTPETLCDLLFRSVDAFGEKECLRFWRGGRWQSLSYAEVGRAVEAISLGLAALGVRRGDHVALWAENRPEWAIVDLAALCLGAVVTPIHMTMTPSQAAAMIEDAAAVKLVASGHRLDALGASRQEALRRLSVIVTLDATTAAEAVAWDEIHARGASALAEDPNAARRRADAVRPDDVATLVYTAGTTGRPKGVLLTHANLVSNVLACHQAFACLGAGDVAFSILPLSHTFERTTDYYLMLHAGATIAYAESQERAAQNLQTLRPTVVTAVPRFYEKAHDGFQADLACAPLLRRVLAGCALAAGRACFRVFTRGRKPGPTLRALHRIARRVALDQIRNRIGGRLRILVSGGAPLPVVVAEFFGAIGLAIREGYGLTETSPVITVNPRERIKPGSVGRPVAGVELRLDDDGEIVVRSPGVMYRYHSQPEEGAHVIDADGWFHTGDLGRLDGDGYLYVTGSKKDLIVTSGGRKIAPLPIENRLRGDPFIDQIVLLGNGRPSACALIVPEFGRLESWAREQGVAFSSRDDLVRRPEVRAFFERRVAAATSDLARFEVVKHVAVLSASFSVETGELTPKLSLRREVIEERYRERIEALYAEPAPCPVPAAPA